MSVSLSSGLEVVRLRPAPEKEAPTLVFLHEGLGSVSQWRDFPQRLAAATGLGAVVYSRAGYGRSKAAPPPWPLDFMEREAAVLEELLDAEGVRSAVLVGHSDGGTIALLHAAAAPRPPRVRALLLLAPHVFCEELTRASIAAAAEEYRHGDLRRRLARYHDHVDDAFGGWSGVWLDPEFATWSIVERLRGVTAPVLVVQGLQDPYGTPAQVEAIVAGCAGPVTVRLLEGCGHAPHREREAETMAAMVRFLEELQIGRTGAAGSSKKQL